MHTMSLFLPTRAHRATFVPDLSRFGTETPILPPNLGAAVGTKELAMTTSSEGVVSAPAFDYNCTGSCVPG